MDDCSFLSYMFYMKLFFCFGLEKKASFPSSYMHHHNLGKTRKSRRGRRTKGKQKSTPSTENKTTNPKTFSHLKTEGVFLSL